MADMIENGIETIEQVAAPMEHAVSFSVDKMEVKKTSISPTAFAAGVGSSVVASLITTGVLSLAAAGVDRAGSFIADRREKRQLKKLKKLEEQKERLNRANFRKEVEKAAEEAAPEE